MSRIATAPDRLIRLHAPGRLHLGFLDPAGTLGRRFGSLGLVIDGIATDLLLSGAGGGQDELTAADEAGREELERVARYLALLRQQTGRHEPLRVELKRVLPPHAGFGSGTQLALALGRAFARWHRLELDSVTLALWLARGLRSGIGIAGFDQGGLLLDGGPAGDGRPAPLLSRIAFPEAWRVIVVQDERRRGLSGAQEKQAIAALPPFPQALSADICHQVLMRVLPAAATAEFEPFAAGINRIQQLLGEHFAPAQGGSSYTSPAVERAIRWIAEAAGDQVATGQSSWGPTGFAIVPSQALAESLIHGVPASTGLKLRSVHGLNHGASLTESSNLAAA